MEAVFIKSIRIDKIRHLENIDINICDSERRHVIVTGKNGSGKTSLLDAIATFINSVTLEDNPQQILENIESTKESIEYCKKENKEIQLKQFRVLL